MKPRSHLRRHCLVWLCAAALPHAARADSELLGAGATFPAPLYRAWAAQYQREMGTAVRYDAVGSGLGIARVESGKVDFGASDVPLAADRRQRMGITQFPAVIGGVTPVVNIAGIKPGALRLTGQVLADIYLGNIRKWNDRAIAELNPQLSLPNSNITVVHRSDASGTTFLWSEFLARSNPQWKAKVGVEMTLDWPVGVADIGNDGVASSVQRTKASIGYVEYAYARAHHLAVVSLRNRAGAYVLPGKASFEAAATTARWEQPADLDQVLVDAPGNASWPIAGASFILLPKSGQRAAQTGEVLKFFDWAFRQGERAASELDYALPPDAARSLVRKLWAQ